MMWGMRTSLALWLALSALHGALGLACGANQGGNAGNGNAAGNRGAPNGNQRAATPAATPTPAPREEGSVGGNLRVLAEGSYGSVEETFVAVVRDADAYAALSAAAGGLPPLGADFFRSNVVVAAFLGTRRTGGYAVQITRGPGGRVRVAESTPPKDAMTTQALTAPFKVVSLETEGPTPARLEPVPLELDDAWRRALRPYRAQDSEFEASGGLAGTRESLRLEGELGVMRLGKLVTLVFDLRGVVVGGKGATGGPRTLQTTATGFAQQGGGFLLPRMDAGTLVGGPNGGLRAALQFTGNDDALSLTFEPLPVAMSDSFQGRGRLSANANGPAPK